MPISMKYEDAKYACTQHDASLVDIFNEDMQQLVTDLAKQYEKNSWLGLHVVNDMNGKKVLEWTNGTSPLKTWWSESETSNDTLSNASSCVILNVTKNHLQNWEYAECSEGSSFICTKESGLCSDGWMQREGHCYFFLNQKKMTWKDSVSFCNLRGAMLIQMNSSDNMQFLSTELPKHFAPDVDSMWLGISEKDGSWSWLSGDTANITSPMWAENASQTDNDGLTKCAYILRDDRDLKWQISADCSIERGVICTAPFNVSVQPPPPVFPESKCQDNWLAGIDSCFTVNSELVTWFEARMKCQQDGGDLAVIANEQDQKLLSSQIKHEVWIGLNDRQQENKFVWLDQNDQVSRTYWRHGDPDSQIIGNMYSENCVAMGSSIGSQDHGKWIDYPCAFKLGIVCQRMAAIPIQQSQSTTSATKMTPSNSTGCGGSWTRSLETGQCYRKGNDKLTWTDAREACRSWKATLLPVQSLQEGPFLAGIAQNDENFWIGVSAIPADSYVWLTVDRKTVSFSNWKTYIGEPVNNDPESNHSTGRNRHLEHYQRKAYCALKSVPRRKWQAVICQRREYYICLKQEESVPACSDGWIADCAIKTCFKFEKTLRNWHEAESACEMWNSHLVHLKSETKYNFVLDEAQNLQVLGMADGIWIGLHDLQVEGNWTWSDGTPFLLKKWAPNQPDDWKGNEDCGGILSEKFVNDYFCTENLTSVCERPAILSAACDHGWELDPNTRTCFKFGYEKKTWKDARAACHKFGGDLAYVNSPDEQLYIYNRIHGITNSQGCWIGASDSTTENIWKGVDGSRLTYTDWGQDEPNNMHIEENCASISFGLSPNHGRWNDQNCTLMLPYVCEKSGMCPKNVSDCISC
ncbi:hypothetical protein CHS0354_043189 [Potamilus streckersoni]|uniref:C-type lectin domain-containing protein n=1 Tax=Potamilus streckersoni TaxID=2493646 RepID=A0AAE0SNB7_9BIVA|nr:hypothetical protein CHS0354_043189 [Potamilus streckersoni]